MMKSFRNIFWLAVSVFSLFAFACVTINIYFPAEKVESIAGEIVNEIRGQDKGEEKAPEKNDKSSLIKAREITLAMFCGNAWADDVTSVSNPTIRALKEKMKMRYVQMKPYYQKGNLKENDNGYVSDGDISALNLKEKRELKMLIDAENGNRELLYREIAKALNIDPAQIEKVGEIFAKEWQKPAR